MIRRFGSKAAFDRVKASHGLVPRAAEVGIDASVGFDQHSLDMRRQSSTLNSHRLVQHAARAYSFQHSEKLYDVLNRKHFIEGGVLNDDKLLLDSCAEAGMNRDDCATYLSSDAGTSSILEAYDAVQGLGIHSIPTLVVDGRFLVDGTASGAEELVEVLRSLAAAPLSEHTGKRLFAQLANAEA
jgi:predicted DsbA family dithiol-disulfide isomerase